MRRAWPALGRSATGNKTGQCVILMFLHVSASSRRHLQVATVTGDTCGELCNLAVNGELYPHVPYSKLINSY